jgi:hypothetical protein
MKSILLAAAMALPALSAATASADCYYADDVRRAARLVADEAEDFHDISYRRYRYEHLSDDALEVADSARYLERVARRSSSCYRIRDAYERVEADFNRLRRGFEGIGFHSDQRILDEWAQLTGAVYGLESAFQYDDEYPYDDQPF